jgi:hypothetical protein
MTSINEIADGFLEEAKHDYIGLWAISGSVRWDFHLSNNEEVKARSLDVVRILLDHGLLPGAYLKTGFRYWKERDAASILARIDKEWDAAKGDPPLPHPICWFTMKQPPQ